MSIFRKLSWFFKLEKKTYLIGVSSLILVALIQLIPPKVIGIVVDSIASRQLTAKQLIIWVGILILVAVTQYFLRYVWRTNIWGGSSRLEKMLRKRLFHHFTVMDNTFFKEHRTGDLMAHATNDLTAIQNVAGAGILTFADSFITGSITIIAMVLFVDWRLTLIALLPLPLLALTSKILGAKLHDAFRESQETFSDINDKTQESVSGIKVIKTFGQEKEDIEEFEQKINHSIEKNNRVNTLDALFDPLITLIIGAAYVITIVLGGYYVVHKQITIGQFVSFINYIAMLVWPMFAIGRLFNVLERGNASYDRVQEMLSKKSSIVERENAIIEPAKGTIQFEINQFQYPDGEHPVLTNIDFTLEQGHTLGIVGKTGAGKTTLLKLLLREYDDYAGTIQFGKQDIRDYSLNALLQSIGYVPQDHFLFSMTVKDNIRFASPKLSQAKVEEVAELTAIHEDILSFPEQYETMVGERGVSLSGGQKQRLSIARALVLNPELLILDDALSAVDAKTEEKILSNLKEQRKEKTTIIAAHRLSSVKHAQEILVLDEGKIIERGTHQTLLAKQGWYAKMYEQQQLAEKIEGSEG